MIRFSAHLIALLTVLLTSSFGANAKKLPLESKRLFLQEEIKNQQAELEAYIGQSVTLPNEFHLQALAALCFYPELRESTILFEESNIKTTMKCIPKINFIFKRRHKRIYRIVIDNKRKKEKGVLLKDVPFNGQIGVIGHELGHVFDYSMKNSFGIISTGIRYLFPRYRRKLENQIDRIAIDHQLGWQVYDFASYVFDEDNTSKKYIEYKTKYYYLPQTLKAIILEISR